MARSTTIEWTCDRCGAETDVVSTFGRLPVGWATVEIVTQVTTVKMRPCRSQVCSTCLPLLLFALSPYDQPGAA